MIGDSRLAAIDSKTLARKPLTTMSPPASSVAVSLACVLAASPLAWACAVDANPNISAALAEPIINVTLDGRIETFITFPPLLRSEEHTSELQSLMRLSYAVFRLKKKI